MAMPHYLLELGHSIRHLQALGYMHKHFRSVSGAASFSMSVERSICSFCVAFVLELPLSW